MMSDSVLPYAFIVSSVVYVLLVLSLGRLTLQPIQFRLMMIAGALNATSGAFSVFLEDHYWMPRRLGGASLGIEDALIAAVVAMIPWYLVAVLWQKKLTVDFQWRRSLKRIVCLMVLAYLTYLIGVSAGIDPMTMLLLICVALAIGLLIRRPQAWPLAATGAVIFGLVWFVIVKATFILLPGFIHQWNLLGTWGKLVCGVPVGEIAWALIFGALLPVLVSFTFDVRITGARYWRMQSEKAQGEVT